MGHPASGDDLFIENLMGPIQGGRGGLGNSRLEEGETKKKKHGFDRGLTHDPSCDSDF
jgi:hypothetical protein